MDDLLNRYSLIAVGAEAALYKGKFLNFDVVVKYRLRKPYRLEDLDLQLRVQRTVLEAKVIRALMRVGVKIPPLLYVDPEEGILVVKYIEGSLLRDVIRSGSIDRSCKGLRDVGRYVGRMHSIGVVHGDLTTSNVIITPDNIAYLIDFGLSKFSNRVEDMATDIHLFIRSLESAHFKWKDVLLKCFISGYYDVRGNEAGKVIAAAKEIRLRGRYIEERRAKKA
jgi:TP53 regulating kinase-like protein